MLTRLFPRARQLLHVDKTLPFNVTRDLLGVPIVTRNLQEEFHQVWDDYYAVRDIDVLKEHKDDKFFWNSSLKVFVQNPTLFPCLLDILRSKSLCHKLNMPEDYREKLILTLYYHEKFKYADILAEKLVSGQVRLNWELLVKCALVNDAYNQLLLRLYGDSPSKRKPYAIIMKTLRELQTDQSTINRFSNMLVTEYGISDIPSNHFNYNLKMNIIAKNTGGLRSMLKAISDQQKPLDWLSKETGVIIAQYICLVPKKSQLVVLNEILDEFKDQKFALSFWNYLFKKSLIDMNELERLSKDVSDTELITLKAKRYVTNNSQPEFWDLINDNQNNEEVFNDLSLHMLIMKIRKSNNLTESLELVKVLIQSSNDNLKIKQYIKNFIIESIKVIKHKKIYHRVSTMDKFENFLKSENLLEPSLQNYFIYYDLKLQRFSKVLERLKILFNDPIPLISPYTIDFLSMELFKNSKSLARLKVFNSGEDLNDQILHLIFKCQDHCKTTLSPTTWNLILNNLIDNTPIESSKNYILKIKNVITQQLDPKYLSMNPRNENHPLKLIFNDKIIRKIIHYGFIQQPLDPWVGLKVVKELESQGVPISKNNLQNHLVKYIKIHHGYPGIKPKWGKFSSERQPLTDVTSTVSKINKIYST